MKLYSVFLSGLLAVGSLSIAEDAPVHGRYYAELQALKDTPETKLMFDEDAHQGLAGIERDIIIRKDLTQFQRFVRGLFLMCDVVLVTPETMPLLHGYVEDVCKKANMVTPTVFITRHEGIFNAFAQKLLMSSGAILIGQKLMKEVSDESLEGIVAHELGHIKYNHVNKALALSVLGGIMHMLLLNKLEKYITVKDNTQYTYAFKQYLLWEATKAASSLMVAFIINKRFEKEADAFAYEANGKANGLIEFFELLLKKDEIREEEFVTVYELLQNNKSSLSGLDYYRLAFKYYIMKGGHLFTKAYKMLYHETFVGAHPSPEARIKAAQDYLAQQNA